MPCPEAQELAAYADGTLTAAERHALEGHLADCADCRTVLTETAAFGGVASEALPSHRRRVGRTVIGVASVIGVAAALLLAVRVFSPQRSDLRQLVAALNHEPTRRVEGRLAGDFSYAPPPSVTRGSGQPAPSAELLSAAAALEADKRTDASVERRSALGVALLAIGDVDRAVEILDAAASRAPTADRYNDLAVAYLTRAVRTGRTDDLPLALRAVDRALDIRRDDPTALFNKTLILLALNRPLDAKQSADAYAHQDGSSRWADELRARVAR